MADSIPISVVGRQYCISEFPVDIMMVRKSLWDHLALSRHNFTVLYVEDIENVKGKEDFRIIFQLEAKWSLHDHRILCDTDGNSIVTLRKKKMTMHGRWQVFRGESSEEENLLFTAKKSSCLQRINTNIKMDVFLANNTTQETPDFKMEGSSSEMDGIIYAGDGQSKTNILAQCEFLRKDLFRVRIYPNVDYAFIIALIAILLDNIDPFDSSKLHPLVQVIDLIGNGLGS